MKKYIRKIKHRIGRMYSRLHCYDFQPTNAGWEKYNKPVFPNDKCKESYFDPYVRKWGNTYRMYVSDRSRNSIILLVSNDGVKWKKENIVLKGNKNETWDRIVNRASVVYYKNKWLMWYTGQNNGKSAIGIAESDDGFIFRRIQDKPILIPEFKYEKKSIMNPCVLWDEKIGKFRMWYSAGDQYEPDVLCYAESEDGINWTKYIQNPILTSGKDIYDQCKVGACDILFLADKYYMFYIGYQTVDIARICVAYSKDGIKDWEKLDKNPIISPEKNKWDAHAVYKPTVYYDEKRNIIELWYNGRKTYEEKIGYAYKKIKGDQL